MKSDNPTNQSLLSGPWAIGGWLLILCIWLAIVRPAYGIGLTLFLQNRINASNPVGAEELRLSGWGTIMWIVVAIRSAISIAAGASLYFRREASTVPIVIACLWIAGPTLIVLPTLLVESEISASGLTRSVLVATAWSLYLWFSPRVRRTYRIRQAA